MEPIENNPQVSAEEKKQILKKLVEAEGFERFLQNRYLGQKRFSLEGLESLIPLLDVLTDEASLRGSKEVHIGMAHRGRLNVLANIMKKPLQFNNSNQLRELIKKQIQFKIKESSKNNHKIDFIERYDSRN